MTWSCISETWPLALHLIPTHLQGFDSAAFQEDKASPEMFSFDFHESRASPCSSTEKQGMKKKTEEFKKRKRKKQNLGLRGIGEEEEEEEEKEREVDFDICWTQNRKKSKSIKKVEALDAVSSRRRRRRLCLLALRFNQASF